MGEFDMGFDPELRFAVPAVYVNVHARFLAREEKETEAAFTEYESDSFNNFTPAAATKVSAVGSDSPVANLHSVWICDFRCRIGRALRRGGVAGRVRWRCVCILYSGLVSRTPGNSPRMISKCM
ncbi:hypothetical protein LLG90_11510 [Aromatoleum toluclasticum]|uniref:hypothetical protein n=1 Tax=Aromatoleum toluclasticum TaxID=92003 RepID=UPI001D18F0BA|nr:hypothetical protein [Aromatoleum toluclasticum]MCC4115976.1 hypothetical protein [Aromatoleum toluclasticum]